MSKFFNVNGACRSDRHYMVNLTPKLEKIKEMIDGGQYFTINKARQFGKTTTLRALSHFLKNDYMVISLDFQKMSFMDFEKESAFVRGLAREINKRIRNIDDVPATAKDRLLRLEDESLAHVRMAEIFDCFSDWCGQSEKPVVLIIDEVDTATNNQVFIDFLSQLRAAYLDSDVTPAFQSVILAGVYDVRNIKRKLRPEEEHRANSPWNIAAKFRIDMSFSVEEIAGMLHEYEADSHTGMNVEEMARLIYDDTFGYPYLVSCLCKNIDEEISGAKNFPDKSSAWTREGFLEAEKILVSENNPLFQSLIGKLVDYPELHTVLYELLFNGKSIPYVPQNEYIEAAAMFGFIRNNHGTAVIFNRIFETVLYNLDYLKR